MDKTLIDPFIPDFSNKNGEFYCKTASSIEEASKLIEAGFEYVTTFGGVMLFGKRK
jgi:hypothetical protein